MGAKARSLLAHPGFSGKVLAVLSTTLYLLGDDGEILWVALEEKPLHRRCLLASFQPVQMLPVIPSLALVPAFTALMVCIHSYASEEKRIWSRLGLAFTFIYASMAAINYMTQLFPVWRSINHGETDGLAMFVLGNPHSIFWALAYAYIFMHLAMLFAAPVFAGNPLEQRIRALFILNGVSGLVTIVNLFFDSPPLYLLGSLIIWCPVFTAATVATAVLFNRIARKQ